MIYVLDLELLYFDMPCLASVFGPIFNTNKPHQQLSAFAYLLIIFFCSHSVL